MLNFQVPFFERCSVNRPILVRFEILRLNSGAPNVADQAWRNVDPFSPSGRTACICDLSVPRLSQQFVLMSRCPDFPSTSPMSCDIRRSRIRGVSLHFNFTPCLNIEFNRCEDEKKPPLVGESYALPTCLMEKFDDERVRRYMPFHRNLGQQFGKIGRIKPKSVVAVFRYGQPHYCHPK